MACNRQISPFSSANKALKRRQTNATCRSELRSRNVKIYSRIERGSVSNTEPVVLGATFGGAIPFVVSQCTPYRCWIALPKYSTSYSAVKARIKLLVRSVPLSRRWKPWWGPVVECSEYRLLSSGRYNLGHAITSLTGDYLQTTRAPCPPRLANGFPFSFASPGTPQTVLVAWGGNFIVALLGWSRNYDYACK